MITKEQIEKAANNFAQCEYIDGTPIIPPEEIFWQQVCFTRGAEWALEQCTYSREDMISFGKWVWFEAHGWYRDYNAIKQFLKHWEEQK